MRGVSHEEGAWGKDGCASGHRDREHAPPRHAVGPKEGPKEAVQGLGLGPQAGGGSHRGSGASFPKALPCHVLHGVAGQAGPGFEPAPTVCLL